MNPNKKSRQTNIINDLDAITSVMQGGKRKAARKKSKKSKNTPGTGPQAAPVASSSKAKPAKKPTATPNAGPRFYEKNGVKISLYEKSGKKRAHARLSSSLRNKNTEFLLDVIDEYAGADKRKEIKDADKSKAEKADWIEEHETYALGPNLKSRLTLAMPDPDGSLNTEDEAAPWANTKPPPKDVKRKGKGKAPAHSPESDQGTKHKRDNAPEPAQALEQTPKKSKTHHAERQLAEQSLAGQTQADITVEDERRKSQIEENVAYPRRLEAMPILSDEDRNRMEEEEARQKKKDRLLHNFRLEDIMGGLGMHPDNPDTSSMVVQLPEQGESRVLTASTNQRTSTHILHDTPISYDSDQRDAQETQPSPSGERLYLKTGKHGRGGDFDDDLDRRTGRGHQVSTGNQASLEEYLSFRGHVLKKYPQFPRANSEEEVHHEVKKAWNKNELWNCNFSNKYSGYAFSHLWPCGCQKVRGESEDDESEEEGYAEVKAFWSG